MLVSPASGSEYDPRCGAQSIKLHTCSFQMRFFEMFPTGKNSCFRGNKWVSKENVYRLAEACID
ncbi:hypothetical protein HMPREF0742_00255 [Rothia aeria F0184]|uniref:Uncharacterized protein n=1 Tax=Rothia aeria F0184 TaxID=888019 RepID=U7V729_9MICC|nr:hypothetical protein HMPREF0742_00255 [Rothia aeria F0184]